MGFIREPSGVDFIINSPPLTDKEREEISEHIQKYKAKKKNSLKRRQKVKKSKTQGTLP